jgi:hypothetical protein
LVAWIFSFQNCSSPFSTWTNNTPIKARWQNPRTNFPQTMAGPSLTWHQPTLCQAHLQVPKSK